MEERQLDVNSAVLTLDNITFAIVEVRPHILTNERIADSTIYAYRNVFPNMPVVLMAKNRLGKASYYGDENIVARLVRVKSETIPWRKLRVKMVA